MEAEQSIEQKITELANVKFSMNCVIAGNAKQHFMTIKHHLQKLAGEITEVLQTKDKRYKSNYFEADDNQAEIQIGEDTVWFHLHPNLFRIHEANPAYRFSYLKGDLNRAHCAVINVYNFLTDTLVNKRENDLGILIARVFVNLENHFIVETRKPMGINYNDLPVDVLDEAKLKDIVSRLVLFCLEQDLVAQPYDQVQTITYQELSRNNFSRSISGSKQLGFKFRAQEEGFDVAADGKQG